MTDQKHTILSGSDPLCLGDDLLAIFHQRPLAVAELGEWLRLLLAIAGDAQQLHKNADQASGVVWALYLTWQISAEEAEAMIEQLNPICHMHYRALTGPRCIN